jgi:hypothetical protein
MISCHVDGLIRHHESHCDPCRHVVGHHDSSHSYVIPVELSCIFLSVKFCSGFYYAEIKWLQVSENFIFLIVQCHWKCPWGKVKIEEKYLV